MVTLSLSLSLNIIIMDVSYYIYKCMSWKMKSQNIKLMFFYLFWCVRAWIHSLQQWFKHCLRRRRYSCPVCMQKCTAKNVSRLYFQSVEDSNDSVLAKNEEDPQDLRCQIQRLEDKVDGLSSLFKFQGKDLKTGVNSIDFCPFFFIDHFCWFCCLDYCKKVVPLFDSESLFGRTFHYWFCDGFCSDV